eukprot:1148812-Pelagomonas_calceolata.AAC.8
MFDEAVKRGEEKHACQFLRWEVRGAARKLKPQQSPRPHAAFIDSSQAYDTVPCLQFWDHLQRIAMPTPLLQEIKEKYQDDEYIMVDGNKRPPNTWS